MELSDEFTVGLPIEDAWAVLTNLERIAPCLPGAQLREVTGDDHVGVVTVKVRPITTTYEGDVRFIEQDAPRRAVLRAEGPGDTRTRHSDGHHQRGAAVHSARGRRSGRDESCAGHRRSGLDVAAARTRSAHPSNDRSARSTTTRVGSVSMNRLRPSVDELLDRFEILELFNRYTHHHDVIAPRFAAGGTDGSEFDAFDDIFTDDAVLDFSASGGIRADLATMKEWLPSAYANFPVQHHLMGQTALVFTADGNEADARTWIINPMGVRGSDGEIEVFVTGGFYLDHLVRTDRGWRIRERSYDQQWLIGDVPSELALPPR